MRFLLNLLATTSMFTMLALSGFTQELAEAEVDPAPVENRFRVGIDCVPVPEPLQVQLNLDEGTGLLVNGVMDGSPASKAGLKRFDVILAANERPVGVVTDLVRAVNEAGASEMNLSIIRRGERMQVKVTPEQRDEEEIERIRRGFRNRLRDPVWGGFPELPPEIQRQMERFGPLDEMFGPDGNGLGNGLGWRRILPGIIMDNVPPRQLPNGFNFNLQVERTGDGPAKIKVQQGDKAWEVTEDNLDDLPQDVRRMVENMLHGTGGGWSGLMVPNQPPEQLPRPVRPDQDNSQLKQRFDGLELQLQELQNAINSLKDGD